MESKAQILGRSLKVPIAQELAKEKLSSVPSRSRYIRPDHQHLTAADVSSLPQIPVIDMQKLLLSDSMDSELHRLHEACLDWGFFQLINHGVEAAPIAKMRSEMTAFFNLPPEEKDVFRQKEDDVEGYGQAFVTAQEQKLDWGDLFFVLTSPPYLRKPHLIPKLPASFRCHIYAYGAELRNLAMKILGYMAKALGLKAEDMTSVFEEGTRRG